MAEQLAVFWRRHIWKPRGCSGDLRDSRISSSSSLAFLLFLLKSTCNPLNSRMEKHVNTCVWHACAGVRHLKTLTSSSTVYYFPQGHVENYGASTAVKALCANLPATKCEIVSVEFLADQATDEVYARIRLAPHVPGIAVNPRPEIAAEVNRLAKVFVRRLDTCDLSRELSVFDKQLNVNEIFMKKEDMYLKIGDIHGKVWNFWKTYNHAQSCHSLTSGWPEFVASKKLSAGDDLLFMKSMDGEITVGVRRRPVNMNGAFLGGIQEDKLPNGGRKCTVEDLAEAMGKAFAKLEFQVLYYPSVGCSCMIHDAKEVEKTEKKPSQQR
uniref:Auxin response factor 17 n=2 Tax=Noccaea caerulescens TaxID=107243 RepID=A0A1J3F481_NOCCA